MGVRRSTRSPSAAREEKSISHFAMAPLVHTQDRNVHFFRRADDEFGLLERQLR